MSTKVDFYVWLIMTSIPIFFIKNNNYLKSLFFCAHLEHFKPLILSPQTLQYIENPSVSYFEVLVYLYIKITMTRMPIAAATIHNIITKL